MLGICTRSGQFFPFLCGGFCGSANAVRAPHRWKDRPLPSVLARYNALVQCGALERDPAQLMLVDCLDGLAVKLGEAQLARKGSALGWLFCKKPPEPVKGLYIWGSVGRGKTMLMELFYEVTPVSPKKRVHFHAFMADIHARIFAFRQKVKAGEVKDTDPIPPVAAQVAAEARLLCFDEFTVTDIADAMILGRLFSALFLKGVTVVCTSNVEPSRLYEDGLNRALFLPFIALLQERMAVIELDSRTDFRLEKLGGAPVWYVPADAAAQAALDDAFLKLTGARSGPPVTLTVKGHEFVVPQGLRGVARASFNDLCAKPLGASDYLAMAEKFHTLILDDIPVMEIEKRNEAKRFILLIDELYDTQTKLIASAAAEPTELYKATSGREAFEFDRTASRLIEMRSHDYLALPHGRTHLGGSSTGLVET